MIDQIIESLNGFLFFKNHFAQIIGFFTFALSILMYFFIEETNQMLDKAYNTKNLGFARSGFFQIHSYKIFKIKRLIVTLLCLSVGFLIFYTHSVFSFIKYFNIVVIVTTLAFLNHKKTGKRATIFKLFTMQNLFIAILTLFYLSIASADIQPRNFDSFKSVINIIYKANTGNFYKTALFLSPMFVMLAMCGFVPFNGLINSVFKKLSPSEKILYVGVVINVCQYTIIQLYSRQAMLLYVAIFYLIVNASQIIFAQKINDILISLIRFAMSVFLILISIANLSTNYASLFIYSVFVFTFACILCYEWMYYDIGFFNKPKTIITKIKKFNIYNKYSLKSLILIAISLQIVASPISASFLPFLFLQLTFNNVLVSYYLMFFVLFVISLAIVKLIYPFYICLKYSTSFTKFNFAKDKQQIQTYFDKTNIVLAIVLLTQMVFAIYFNLSYLIVYQNLYILDSLIYCSLAIFIAYLFYTTKFYVLSLMFINKTNKHFTNLHRIILRRIFGVIIATNNICLNAISLLKIKSISVNKAGSKYYANFIKYYNM